MLLFLAPLGTRLFPSPDSLSFCSLPCQVIKQITPLLFEPFSCPPPTIRKGSPPSRTPARLSDPGASMWRAFPHLLRFLLIAFRSPRKVMCCPSPPQPCPAYDLPPARFQPFVAVFCRNGSVLSFFPLRLSCLRWFPTTFSALHPRLGMGVLLFPRVEGVSVI